MASLTSDSRVIYATNTMKQVDTKREPAIRTYLNVCVLMAVFVFILVWADAKRVSVATEATS